MKFNWGKTVSRWIVVGTGGMTCKIIYWHFGSLILSLIVWLSGNEFIISRINSGVFKDLSMSRNLWRWTAMCAKDDTLACFTILHFQSQFNISICFLHFNRHCDDWCLKKYFQFICIEDFWSYQGWWNTRSWIFGWLLFESKLNENLCHWWFVFIWKSASLKFA